MQITSGSVFEIAHDRFNIYKNMFVFRPAISGITLWIREDDNITLRVFDLPLTPKPLHRMGGNTTQTTCAAGSLREYKKRHNIITKILSCKPGTIYTRTCML